jgi:hypothetical protein
VCGGSRRGAVARTRRWCNSRRVARTRRRCDSRHRRRGPGLRPGWRLRRYAVGPTGNWTGSGRWRSAAIGRGRQPRCAGSGSRRGQREVQPADDLGSEPWRASLVTDRGHRATCGNRHCSAHGAERTRRPRHSRRGSVRRNAAAITRRQQCRGKPLRHPGRSRQRRTQGRQIGILRPDQRRDRRQAARHRYRVGQIGRKIFESRRIRCHPGPQSGHVERGWRIERQRNRRRGGRRQRRVKGGRTGLLRLDRLRDRRHTARQQHRSGQTGPRIFERRRITHHLGPQSGHVEHGRRIERQRNRRRDGGIKLCRRHAAHNFAPLLRPIGRLGKRRLQPHTAGPDAIAGARARHRYTTPARDSANATGRNRCSGIPCPGGTR